MDWIGIGTSLNALILRETLCGANKRIRDAGRNADISSNFIHYWLSIDSFLTSADSLLISTDSLPTSTDSLLTYRKQTCFKFQFYVGVHLAWTVFGLIFAVLDLIPVFFFWHFGLKSGHLKMQIPQGRSAQIRKLKKTSLLWNSCLHRNITDLECFWSTSPNMYTLAKVWSALNFPNTLK